jgi:hypothetical protein
MYSLSGTSAYVLSSLLIPFVAIPPIGTHSAPHYTVMSLQYHFQKNLFHWHFHIGTVLPWLALTGISTNVLWIMSSSSGVRLFAKKQGIRLVLSVSRQVLYRGPPSTSYLLHSSNMSQLLTCCFLYLTMSYFSFVCAKPEEWQVALSWDVVSY